MQIIIEFNGEVRKFNAYHFNLFCKYYGIKENPKLCYKHELTHTHGYSIQTIDFIVEEIKKDPDNIFQNLREYLSKNKLTPGAKEFLVSLPTPIREPSLILHELTYLYNTICYISVNYAHFTIKLPPMV